MLNKLKMGWERYRIFMLLYFVQGLVGAFLGMTLLHYLQNLLQGGQAIGKEEAGYFLGLLGAPWIIKPIFAPLVDKWSSKNSHRGRARLCFDWIALSTVVMIVGLVLIVNSDEASTMMHAAILVNLARAIQDVATDALAIHTVAREGRGPMQSSMAAASFLGELLGAAGLIALISTLGWYVLVNLVALLLLVFGLIWPMMLLATVRPVSEGFCEGPGWRIMLKSTLKWSVFWALLLGLTANICDGGTAPVIEVWIYQDLGYSNEGMASLLAFNGWFKILGSMLGGWFVYKLVQELGVAISLIGKVFAYLAIGMLASYWSSYVLVYVLVMCTAIFEGAFVVAMRTYFMDLTSKSAAATQFAVYMAAMNASTSLAGAAGGLIGENFAVATVFTLVAGLQLVSLVPLVVLWLRKKTLP
jgi:MFS transporter, PAT family, beta-lactamase induction signal transducer AmpG